MPLLLTAAGLRAPAIRAAFFAAAPPGGRAVIITTASVEWKERNRHAVKTAGLLAARGFAAAFLDIEREDPAPLGRADLIYLNGGDPFHLLRHLRRSGAGELLRRRAGEILIAGASAGAAVLGRDISVLAAFDPAGSASGLADWSALGLAELSVFPHYDRWLAREPRLDALLAAHAGRSGEPVTPLADNQALLIRDGGLEWIIDESGGMEYEG